jgi:hypothetical protein
MLRAVDSTIMLPDERQTTVMLNSQQKAFHRLGERLFVGVKNFQ